MELSGILTSGGSALLIILTLVQIVPIKLDPWKRIAKWIGRALNGEVMERQEKVIERQEKLSKEVESLRNECKEREAVRCRVRILRFADDLMHGINHSKEHFDHTLTDVSCYEQYCSLHPEFKNNITIQTIEYIENEYQERINENSFL